MKRILLVEDNTPIRENTSELLELANYEVLSACNGQEGLEIALKENPDLKVKIIGHTDSDRDDKSNLDLSKQRALAVKNALINEFGIDGSRMETDGKGEVEPADKNSTAEGKANNRRVEFIKF